MFYRDDHEQESQSIVSSQEQGLPMVFWREENTQQLRVLLHAEPLLRLLRRDQGRGGTDFEHYDSLTLAIALLNNIVNQTGFDAEMDVDRVTRELRPLLVAMDLIAQKEPDGARHQRISQAVLAALRNEEASHRPFTRSYTVFNEQGQLKELFLSLRLLEERYLANGQVALRLSNEAVNLLMHSLTLDIENAQTATEAIIQRQIKLGLFFEAERSALLARIHSTHLCEKFEQTLATAKRDYQQVHWRDTLSEINRAIIHLLDRAEVEREIAQTARARRSHLEPGSKEATHLTTILQLIESCQQSHIHLHLRLYDANQTFLEEQERQGFRLLRPSSQPSLAQDVLTPLLQASYQDAEATLTHMFSLCLPARAPSVFSLSTYLEHQLQPPRSSGTESKQMKERSHLVSRTQFEHLRYSPSIRKEVENFFAQQHGTKKLTALLHEILQQTKSVETQEYLLFSVLHAFRSKENTHRYIAAVSPEPEQFSLGAIAGDESIVLFKE